MSVSFSFHLAVYLLSGLTLVVPPGPIKLVLLFALSSMAWRAHNAGLDWPPRYEAFALCLQAAIYLIALIEVLAQGVPRY